MDFGWRPSTGMQSASSEYDFENVAPCHTTLSFFIIAQRLQLQTWKAKTTKEKPGKGGAGVQGAARTEWVKLEPV